ncbi:MAG: ABC transporter ATP-binding protein [Trueperaceae bacterium]
MTPPAPAAGDAPPLVTTRGLGKDYAGVVALADVDLLVPRGSVYGVVGPNGAGKTTLLSILVGLKQPTSGTLEVAVERARIALVPDTPSFEPWLTAREVVALARSLVGLAPSAEAVDATLRRTGLADAADRASGGFSRGMLQRLGLAAAMAGEPTLLVLDEPAAALDPAGRRDVLDLVSDLRGGTTILFSSHILTDVQQVCDTIGILRDGRLLFQGPTRDLLAGKAAPAFTVRLRPPLDDVIGALEAAPWVHLVERAGLERLRVTVASTDAAETELVRTLADAGARVVGIAPAEVDLEHVFLELTG